LPFVFILFIALVGSVATSTFVKTLVSWLIYEFCIKGYQHVIFNDPICY